MAFKMNGSPAKMGTISGTAGHSSALKMKKESMAKMYKDSPMDKALVGDQDNLPEHLKAKIEAAPGKMYDSPAKQKAASALKQDPYADAKKKDPNLDTYIAERKKHKPGSDEYEAAQAKVNAAYGKVRSKKLKKAQVANANKEKTVTTPPTSQKTVPASDATTRKEGAKRDSIVKDENKDGNMLTRGINKLKQGSKKRKAKQIEKNKGTKYKGMTNFQKRQAIRAEKRKAK